MKIKGFTLIELIIVMAVVGVLGALAISVFPNSRERAEDSVIKNDLLQYQSSLEQFANLNDGLYPGGITTIRAICSQLTTNVCNSDSADTYNYRSSTSNTQYYIWATLEATSDSGQANYFVVCSNGVRGETEVEPSGEICPI